MACGCLPHTSIHQLNNCMNIGPAWWSPQDDKQQREKYSAKTGTLLQVNRDELVQTNLPCRPRPHYEQEGKKTDRRTCQRKEKKMHTQQNCSLITIHNISLRSRS